MADAQNFAFRFEPGYRWAALPFGVTARSASIVVSRDVLGVRFGPWRVSTPLSNIARVEISGPYAAVKTAGPARLSFKDRGLTFATNHEQGVCMQFRQPITGIDPFGLVRHPNLTLTAADCYGLMIALQA
ncbi:MAG: hypothetical protein M3N95_13855 [Actinomycetota bacterium]|nr:hypothetical protein [Actinomycetota bacterium]